MLRELLPASMRGYAQRARLTAGRYTLRLGQRITGLGGKIGGSGKPQVAGLEPRTAGAELPNLRAPVIGIEMVSENKDLQKDYEKAYDILMRGYETVSRPWSVEVGRIPENDKSLQWDYGRVTNKLAQQFGGTEKVTRVQDPPSGSSSSDDGGPGTYSIVFEVEI